MELFEIVGIAEPIDERRNYLANKFGIPENMRFKSWEPLLALGKIADAAIIATATMTSNAIKQSTEDSFAVFNSIKGGEQ